ncbi:MAG: TRAP transporter fused permease subunit [Treponema sp.]|nr:TRAP transporter fused permease subunit [Treponema sp.]
MRTYSGPFKIILTCLAIFWVVFQLYFNTIGSMEAISFRAYHSLFLLIFCFCYFPLYRKEALNRKLPGIFDFVLIALSLFVFMYFILNYPRIAMAGGFVTQAENILGILALILVFLAARRAAGALVWLALIFLAYNVLGRFLPDGPFRLASLSVNRIVGHLFWSSQGIFGTGIGVSATYIFVFILFGSFLNKSGFTNLINDLSLTLVGKTAGGPAKVAVLANGLMGMINGAATAIVATTGSITIPMMRKAGYSKEYSAGVVAAAASGGQFCPPIMGAVAFLMAEFLGVSYTVVAMAAIVPAFLYYFGILAAVHFKAKSEGLSGLSMENLPNAIQVLKKEGHLLAPLISLLIIMFLGFTPLFACVISIFVTIACSWLRKETRMDLSKIINACEEGVRGAISVGVCCIIIGVIIGTVSLTGLGLRFGFQMLRVVGEGELLKAGVMVAIMSTILGMGVPGIASYVIVTAVAVPVMINAGAVPIVAHLFCLFYASLSNITPPVAISSFVASGIAGSNHTKTAFLAMRVALAGFILPFFFLFNPILLLGTAPEGSTVIQVIISIVTASAGILLLSSATEGRFIRKSYWLERIVCIVAAGLLIDSSIFTDNIGIILLVLLILFQIYFKVDKKKKA